MLSEHCFNSHHHPHCLELSSPLPQIKKLRLRQENWHAQGYTAGKWGELGLKPSTDRGLLENTPISPVGKGVLSGEQAEEERPKYLPWFFLFCFFFVNVLISVPGIHGPLPIPKAFLCPPTQDSITNQDFYGQMEDQLCKHTKRGLTIFRKYK